ncbi:type IV secretory system conjugative DNA transfer family protein [Aliarcobacter butzleri]|uniref:Type IV secretory system conjugative DNA transfer family protein n=1 Tax=Aliarcobacter butzleri TaxID=28197 RepID=A0AAW7Q0N1_9BACT|nr:type IV secretory system conjugative DNA transfer family protein [Aliarcobacter butzleri]MDN5071434.1 type IV secretory system conjugative DNA transfer family protein [Aliarcobacter butzleri]
MNKNKETNQVLVYILAVIGIAFTFTVMSSIATQYLAKSFNYSSSLGETILFEFYNPFNWIFWSITYQSYYPEFFKNFYMYATAGIIISFFVFILIKLIFLRKSKAIKDLHGSAHWATFNEIKKMGILGREQGVYIGGYKNKNDIEYLRHNGPEHTIVFAPTRSGKGVGLVIPTLLSWEESCLIFDIKGELWALTAGWRKQYAKNKVLKFDPTCTDGTGVRFNILEEIRLNTIHEVKDTQNIAINLIFKGETPPQNPSLGNSAYFKSEATSFLTAIILYALHSANNELKPCPSIPDIYKFINNPELTIDELLEEMLDCEINIQIDTIDIIKSIARSMKNKATQELSGVIGSATEVLNLYIDPIIAKNIEKSEFRISDLMNYDSPVSLYIIIPPGDKDRLRPLNNLIVNQIFKTLTRDSLQFENGQNRKNYKHRLLFMADEFTAVGKLGVIEEQLAFIAGYGIKAYIIIQDLPQLHNLYGKDESIISNCHNRVAFAPNKIETADALSRMSGITTVIKKSITSSGNRTAVLLGNVSETLQEVQRPLMTADEVLRIKPAKKDKQGNIIEPGDMLIFISGESPIYGRQILFFKDPVFLERSKVTLDIKTSDITK